MNIPENQILYRKLIGKTKDQNLFQIGTIGGLVLVVKSHGEVLGVGSHPALARHIAAKREEMVEYTELSKNEIVDIQHFQHLIEKYEAETEKIVSLQKSLKK